MSSERDVVRFTARRASLHAALRGGDALVAARAASRVRVGGFALPASEFARAREMRRALGRALVNARIARPVEVTSHAAVVVVRRRPWRALVAALAAATALMLVLLFGAPDQQARGGGSAPPAPPSAEPQPSHVVLVSRGRTISLVPEVVAAEDTPTPAPTATLAPSPTPAPAASVGGVGSGGSASGGAGSGPPGSGGGSGGGDASPTPPPTPAPTATSAIPPAGFSRLNVIVYDATTNTPLPGVCVVIGTIDCGPRSFTNAQGRWSADVAASSNTTRWDMIFLKPLYLRQVRQVTLPGRVSRTYIIFLARSR